MNVLRAAALRLVEWYHNNYWLPQSEYLKTTSLLCITAHLSVKKDNKNVTLNEDLQTFDSLVRSPGSTFFTEIFIPTFINSIYQYNLQETYDKIKKEENAKSREISKIFEFWWDRILKIQETNSKFFTILVLRLCMSIKDSFDKTQIFPRGNATNDTLPKKQFQWRMHVCTSWLEKLLIHLITLAFSNEKKKNSCTNIDFFNEVKKVFTNFDNNNQIDMTTTIIRKYEIIKEISEYSTQLNEITLLAKMINSTDTLKKSIFSVLDDLGMKGSKYFTKECNGSSDSIKDIATTSRDENNIQIECESEEESEVMVETSDVSVNQADNGNASRSSYENKRKIASVNDDQNNSKSCSSRPKISPIQKQRKLQCSRGREEEIIPLGGWFKHAAFTPWPIGILSGESLDDIHRCPLYLLQEVVCKMPHTGKSEERISTDEERNEEGQGEGEGGEDKMY